MNSGQSVWNRVVLALLIIDGAVVGVLSVFFLPLWIGGVPFPLSAFLAGYVNLLLVRTAAKHTERSWLVAAPLLAWGAAVAILALGDMGGNATVPADWRGALLVAVGVLPSAMWLATSALSRAEARGAAAGGRGPAGRSPAKNGAGSKR